MTYNHQTAFKHQDIYVKYGLKLGNTDLEGSPADIKDLLKRLENLKQQGNHQCADELLCRNSDEIMAMLADLGDDVEKYQK